MFELQEPRRQAKDQLPSNLIVMTAWARDSAPLKATICKLQASKSPRLAKLQEKSRKNLRVKLC